MRADTLLVVVDTNRPDMVENPQLLESCNRVAVIDHHRRAATYIENAAFNFHEPYASSASELVTELLQYLVEPTDLLREEAGALLAGIVLDTKHFTQRTGGRTFEAAAFLRRCGADVTRVRKMFREHVEDYRAKGEAIRNAELFRDHFAISVCPSEGLDSPTVVGAQAANELLNIIGVKASFVLTDYRNTIYISARSIDEVNVQVMMEKLGGGGHINMAGAQLKDCTVSEAEEKLRTMIDKMIEDGDITQ